MKRMRVSWVDTSNSNSAVLLNRQRSKCWPILTTCILAFISLLFCERLAHGADFEQTYVDDGGAQDHILNVSLSTGGTYSFAVIGVPNGLGQNYNYEGDRKVGTSWSVIYSASTSVGTDPSFSASVSPGDVIKLIIWDGNWNVKSVYYWYIFQLNRSPTNPGTPTASSITTNSATISWSPSTDPDGDAITYELQYRRANTSDSWTSAGTTSGTSMALSGLSPDQQYSVQVIARDGHLGASSWVSGAFTTLALPETISTPNTPSGPSSGQTGQSLSYSTGGSSSSKGHSLEYRFDWGDGSYSSWSSSTSASHSWSSTGTFQVKAQARCATDTSVVSSWSNSKSLTITPSTATITLTVRNGTSSGSPVVAGAVVQRYNNANPWQYQDYKATDANGQVSWTVTGGTTWNFEAYYVNPTFGSSGNSPQYQPGQDQPEFWGTAESISVAAGGTATPAITRWAPIVVAKPWDPSLDTVKVERTDTGAVLAPGETVVAGTPLRFTVRLQNNSSYVLSCKARLLLDRSKSAPYDRDFLTASWTSTAANGGTTDFTFTWTPQVSDAGDYYGSPWAKAQLANGNVWTTDSWGWSSQPLIHVAGTPPARGITVITHGYQLASTTTPGWVFFMGRDIGRRIGSSKIGKYDTDAGDFKEVTWSGDTYAPQANAIQPVATGESILLFDWASESDIGMKGWSEAAGDALFAALIRFVGGVSNLQNYQWHFIGHSRGAVVNSETVERFAAYGVPVEQVTALDPHDFPGEGLACPDHDFMDWTLGMPQGTDWVSSWGFTTWNNVNYFDNYFSTEDAGGVASCLDPDGRQSGSQSRPLDLGQLTPAINVGHSGVHTWYYGTINLSAPKEEGTAGETVETAYYPNGERCADGWNLSRYGARFESRPSMSTLLQKYAPQWQQADAIFNGDFELSDFSGAEIPGWDLQGGGGSAVVESGHLSLYADAYGYHGMRAHNYFYLPTTATHIQFDYQVVGAGTDDYLGIQLESADGTTYVLGSVSAGATTSGWIAGYRIPISAVVPKGTVYKLAFVLFDANNGVIYSKVNVDNVRLAFGSTPPPPTGVSATRDAYADRVVVSWNAVSGATGYEVWRGAANDTNTASNIQTISSGSTVSYTDSSVTPGTTYYYWLRTKQGTLTSGFSSSTWGWAYVPRTLTVASSSPNSGVTITVTPSDLNGQGNGSTSFTRSYINATTVSLTAPSTASGNTFQKWQRNGEDYSASPAASIQMDANYTLTAVYQTPPPGTVTVTVQTSPSGQAFTVDGTGYTEPAVFSWTSGSCHTIATTSPQSGDTGVQYVWSSWSDGGSISHTVCPSGDTTYTANFTTQYYLTMNIGTGGSSVSPSGGWYNSGASVPISATPASGYSISSWTGTGTGSYSGSSNPASVTMNGPITETATFTLSGCTYALSATATNFVAPGGSGSFKVYANTGCSWSAVPGMTWLQTTSSGSGTGTVTYTVSANTGAARTGTIVIQDKVFTVQQSGTVTNGSRVAIVNPDYYRILKHGRREDDYYYPIANGTVADNGSTTNVNSWTGLGACADYLTTVLTNAGYQVDTYTGDTFPAATISDYALVIVQDPMTEVNRQFSPNVEDTAADLLQYTTNAVFLSRLDSYFSSGGSVILVGDAVRLMENGANRLNYGKVVLANNPTNSVTSPSPVIPEHWFFIRGNPFCCVSRSGGGAYSVAQSSLVTAGAVLSQVSLYDGRDAARCHVWSDTIYSPSDAVSLLDVRIEGSGQYVLDGSVCSPTVYQDSLTNTVPSLMGYTQVNGRKLFFLGSDSFFDYQYNSLEGVWHCSASQGITCQITSNGVAAILGLVSEAIGNSTIATPVAGFSANPTNGAAPLNVSFMDTSTGTITNRVWSFGDGTASSAAILSHAYANPGIYSVSLSVFGPTGSDTLNRPNLIVVTNLLPQITSPPLASNVLGTVDGITVIKPGQTVGFSVGSSGANGSPLSCLWDFGDGGTSTECKPSHVFTNCGPLNVSVTIADGYASVKTDMTVAVTCPMDISNLKLQAKFKKVGSDTCTIKGTLTDLPTGFSIANASVALDAGEATVDFQLNAKGSGKNSNGSIKFSHNKKTGVWTFTGKLKGNLKGSWVKYGITSGTVINGDVTFPVLLMLQSGTLETFDAELPLNYNNKSGVSGTATYVPVR